MKENEPTQSQKKSTDSNPIFNKNVSHFLILNSLALLEKRRETMEQHEKINLIWTMIKQVWLLHKKRFSGCKNIGTKTRFTKAIKTLMNTWFT
jgi:hypothetical protein